MKQLKILLWQQKKNLRKITAYTLYNDLKLLQNAKYISIILS